jgi:hypothetical protein
MQQYLIKNSGYAVRYQDLPGAGHSMALENPAALATTVAAIIHDCMEDR